MSLCGPQVDHFFFGGGGHVTRDQTRLLLERAAVEMHLNAAVQIMGETM